MKMIAAVDKNWAIGKDNGLLISIPEDMKFFRETTAGHVVVMGRKTLDSFPGGRPLKNRTNIVLTRDRNFEREGAVVVHDKDELLEKLKDFDSDDIFVIGGESIYRMLEPLCDTAYITMIEKEFEADAYFPKLSEISGWKMTDPGEKKEHEGTAFAFTTWER